MATSDNKRLVPAIAIHPGEMLREELKERGIKQKELAKQIGIPATHLNEFIKGKRGLSLRLGVALESALGIPYDIWARLQSRYEYNRAAIEKKDAETVSAMKYEEMCRKSFNLHLLYKHLGIAALDCRERVSQLKALFPFDLRFVSEQEMRLAGMYKHSEKVQVDEKNMRTWFFLNLYAIQNADMASLPRYSKENIIQAAKNIAAQANKQELTTEKLKDILNSYGISFLHVAKVDKAPVDAYSTIANGHPVVTATFRYNDMDKLAFDILHELCHIGKHLNGHDKAFISVEGSDEYSKNPREKEANEFAQEMLIPSSQWRRILNASASSLTQYAVVECIGKTAASLGYSPSIAVARYKREMQFYKTKQYPSPKIS